MSVVIPVFPDFVPPVRVAGGREGGRVTIWKRTQRRNLRFFAFPVRIQDILRPGVIQYNVIIRNQTVDLVKCAVRHGIVCPIVREGIRFAHNTCTFVFVCFFSK